MDAVSDWITVGEEGAPQWENGWSGDMRFRKRGDADPDGNEYVEIQGSAHNAPMFTLPEGYRPGVKITVYMVVEDGMVGVRAIPGDWIEKPAPANPEWSPELRARVDALNRKREEIYADPQSPQGLVARGQSGSALDYKIDAEIGAAICAEQGHRLGSLMEDGSRFCSRCGNYITELA